MPQLPMIDAGQALGQAERLALHPTETGIESTAQTAHRVGAFGSQLASSTEMLARETERLGAQTSALGTEKGNLITGEGARLGSAVAAAGDAAVKQVEHDQVSRGSAGYAAMWADLTKQWNDLSAKADPTDPTVAQGFMSSVVEPRLQNFKENGFWTEGAQQWAENHTAALRQHFAEKTASDMSQMAGAGVIANAQKTVNSLSATVHDDPTSLDFALATRRSTTEGLLATSPNLTGPEAARVRSEFGQKADEAIVKSAAIGAIIKTGQVPDWIKDPKYAGFVNGAELKIFEQQAKTEQRRQQLADKQLLITQRQLDDLQVHKDANSNFTANVDFDPATGRAIIKPEFYKGALDIARNNPNAPSAAATAKAYLDWGEQQQRVRAEALVDNPAVKSDLMTRFTNPNQPLTKLEVLRAEADGNLSTRTGNIYREMIDQRDGMPHDPVLHAALDGIKERVGETIMADGHERFANAMAAFWPQYAKLKASGSLPPNALDLEDEKSLIRQTIKAYEPKPEERLQGHIFKSLGVTGLGGSGVPMPTAPPPKIASKADFDKLSSGAIYIGLDGKQYRKP